MITYGELHNLIKAAMIALLFASSVAAIALLAMDFSRKRITAAKILLPPVFIISFVCLTILKSIREFKLIGTVMPEYLQKADALPAGAAIAVTVACTCLLLFFGANELKYRRHSITASSLKEALDNLPEGICYADADGVVLVSNHKINTLSNMLTGSVFNDANKLWDEISGYENLNRRVIPMPDGSIWSFKRETVLLSNESVYKISATDISELHRLSEKLKDNNEKMKQINQRLKEYSKNIDIATRSRERLETKIRIHADMGQTLLYSRHAIMQDDEAACARAIEKWRFAAAIFKTGETTREKDSQWERLLKAAEGIGIKISLNGSLPEDSNAKRLICLAASEATANAVRHAEATALDIVITAAGGYVTAQFTNNGKKPEGKVIPGGGLGSLEKKLVESGGALSIDYGEGGELIIRVSVPHADRSDAI